MVKEFVSSDQGLVIVTFKKSNKKENISDLCRWIEKDGEIFREYPENIN